jgi:hypothetical protein
MAPIHCHRCGGFLGGDPEAVACQPGMRAEDAATPHSGLCTCAVPTIYEPVASAEPHT